ncbi:GPW/gp25 family protein [Foetidibacter luteolus]|uniref:GPW/gp25 family protein n=1 Tax=Foetidibacter luteolus TaxID=2608880 RepID=UPI00129BBCA0|nr:GPW/gp25 family protein [Foetidibacter luteolus]
MATLDNITSPVWGISTKGYGVVVEGLPAIRQCIDLILRTTKRSDPLRPEFGSDIYLHIASPLNIGIPNIKKAIIEALEIWEPRIKVTYVDHYLKDVHNPVFPITYKLVDEDLEDSIIFDLLDGVKSDAQDDEIILQAPYPLNPDAFPYFITFVKNGADVPPMPWPIGYATLEDLFSWVTTNWGYTGRWFQLADKFVLYMRAEGVESASLAISVLPVVRISCEFPPLPIDFHFSISFIVNGADALPPMPAFAGMGQVLDWARTNWSEYGDWYVESRTASGELIFSESFTNEFEDVGPMAVYSLVCISRLQGFEGSLEIIAEAD